MCRESWPALQSSSSGNATGESWGGDKQTSNLPYWGPKKQQQQQQQSNSRTSTKESDSSSKSPVQSSSQGARNSQPPSSQRTPPSSQGAQSQLSPSKDPPPPRTMFGSGGGSTVFSLSKERELVKSQERRSKARGRGRVTAAKLAPLVGGAKDRSRYPAPKPGSGGITVIEPLDKSSDVSPDVSAQKEESQFDDAPVATVPADLSGEQPGLPLRGSEGSTGGAESLPAEMEPEGEGGKEKAAEGDGQKVPSLPQQGGGAAAEAPQQESVVTSKPKRYSSQRQKVAGEQLVSHTHPKSP